MAYSNGKIYGAVSIYDVQRAIGAISPDLGTLCRSANINKWARYKPVIYNKVNIARTRVINTFHLPITPDPSFDALTGLNLAQLAQYFSDPIAIADYDAYVEVAYNRPYGGSASPYRLVDWCEYNHIAQPPVTVMWGSRFAVDSALACKFYMMTGNSDNDSILFSDIINELVVHQGFNVNKTYLCMAAIDPYGEPLWFFFSDEAYNNGKTQWGVQTQNKKNYFQDELDDFVGQNMTFVTFLVNDTNDNIDNDALDYGISAADMSDIRSQFKVCALSLEYINGLPTDRAERECLASSASSFTYILDQPFIAEGLGFFTYNNHDVHVIQITQLGEYYINIPKDIYGSVENGQLRMKIEIGNSHYVYPFNQGTTNRYEVDFQNPTTRQTYVVSDWQTIRNLSEKYDMGTYWRVSYPPSDTAFSFYSQAIKNAQNVPSSLDTINMYYDLDSSATGIENITFSLYFRANSASQEQLVDSQTLPYNIAYQRGETPTPQ